MSRLMAILAMAGTRKALINLIAEEKPEPGPWNERRGKALGRLLLGRVYGHLHLAPRPLRV
jgi:hypothetical protein